MFFSCLLYLLVNVLLDTYFFKKVKSWVSYKYFEIRYGYKGYKNVADVSQLTEVNHEDGHKYNTLRANKLHKTYAGKPVVNNINITLNDGDCLGILGVNGAGKTTTFRMLTREEVVEQGEVDIELDDKKIDIKNDQVSFYNYLIYQ